MRATTVGVLLFFFTPLISAEGNLKIQAKSIGCATASGSCRTLINVSNDSYFETFTDIRLELFKNGQLTETQMIGTLPPLHSSGLTVGGVNDSGEEYVRLSYSFEGTSSSYLEDIDHQKMKPMKDGSTVWVSLISVLGVLAGGSLTHFFTLAREREKSRLDQRRLDLAKFDGPIRVFLACWSKSLSVPSLQTCYQQLQRECLLPQNLVEGFQDALKMLGSNALEEQKTRATETLSRKLETFLNEFR